MKLWKAFSRNSTVYASNFNPLSGNGIELKDMKSRSPTFSDDSGKHSNSSETSGEQRLISVELRKLPGEDLGIVLSRASDLGGCPSIASLRPGSVAYTCDQLIPGDKIHSINGINTSRLRADDVNILLSNVDERAQLEIEYSLPDYASQNSLCVSSKITNVTLERVNGSLGITLRGGLQSDPQHSRPLIITHVRPHGPAHRSGLIKVGDRLLKVDNQNLTNKSLMEAQQILTQQNDSKTNQCPNLTTLTIEYDVNLMESVKYATGPLLVEIERHLNEDLGLNLSNCVNCGENEIVPTGVFIESIRPASIADRCGALHRGDQILAVDDMYIENTLATPEEVMCLLQNTCNGEVTRLQILPCNANKGSQRSISGFWNYQPKGLVPSSPSLSGFSTINSRRSYFNKRIIRHHMQPKPIASPDAGCMSQSNYCGYNAQLGVCHTETLNITLCSEGSGYGLSVNTETSSNDEQAIIIITNIEPNSIADRSGCLQVGDRLLSINRQPNLTIQEINSLLEQGKNSTGKLELQVEFDVADSIVPTSGIFTVKLARQSYGLGITITASKTNSEDPFIISEVRRGSTAHRIGTLHIGDRLLAIDNQNLTHTTLEKAFDTLQNSPNDIVTLKIEKIDNGLSDTSYLFAEDVVYTVELVRHGGPLGITISGSEDCIEPIILSRLIEDGLAEKTGALHVGDRILAINGENLINRPLSDAIRLLQTTGDKVLLKISRRCKANMQKCDEISGNYPSPGVQSIDSAVESWIGSTLDTSTKIEHNSLADENDDNVSEAPTEKTDVAPSQQQPHVNTMLSQKSESQSLQYYSDTEDIFCPSPLPLPNYSFTNTLQNKLEQFKFGIEQPCPQVHKPKVTNIYQNSELNMQQSSSRRKLNQDNFENNLSSFDTSDYDIYHVILYKDAVYDDYGFSVSDGLYEKGVYVNRIRKGGPADIVGLLKPFDRILQVNDTKTQDFDCCLTVPLIASAGDRIELIIARNPNQDPKEMQVLSWITEEQEMSNMCAGYSLSGSESTITKTL